MNQVATDRLQTLRAEALARFETLGFPTTRHEDWRATNVAPIARTSFLSPPAFDGSLPKELESLLLPEMKSHLLVFVNGRFQSRLSCVGPLHEGVIVGSLAESLESDGEFVHTYLGRAAGFQQRAFTALNTASFTDGAFVYVPGGLHLEEPVHVVHVSIPGAEPCAVHPRNLLVLQRGSQACVVESYIGTEATYFTNPVTEIMLEAGAILDHVKLQREGTAALHIGRTAVHQAIDSHLHSGSIAIGGKLVRNDLDSLLDGSGADCEMNGLYLAREQQHIDNHTIVDHAVPHCSSQEMYKGVLAGKGSAVFNGKVIVRKDAQKTDAQQSNKNLLLSETSVIDTKPELEIYADDVKCTHGATIGQIDKDSMFYLQARGIAQDEARSLLIYAFASEVLGRLRLPEVRTQLEQQVMEWFGRKVS